MSEQTGLPIDELTGLPPLVLTVGTARELPEPIKTNHHHPHFPRQHPDLEGRMELTAGHGSVLDHLNELTLDKLGGLAVRVSRTQRLVPEAHDLLHKKFPAGSPIPATVHEKFVVAVKNCAGFVPRQAVDVTAAEGREMVNMDSVTLAAVAHPWNMHIEEYYYDRPAGYQKRVLGTFFLRYAAAQNLRHLPPSMLEEFATTSDNERKFGLGRYILREAIEVGIEPLVPLHRELARLGMVQGNPNLRQVVWGLTPHAPVAPILERLAGRLAS